MFRKNQEKTDGSYAKCTNDKCGVYWESTKIRLCQLCGNPVKIVVIKEDGKTETDAR